MERLEEQEWYRTYPATTIVPQGKVEPKSTHDLTVHGHFARLHLEEGLAS